MGDVNPETSGLDLMPDVLVPLQPVLYLILRLFLRIEKKKDVNPNLSYNPSHFIFLMISFITKDLGPRLTYQSQFSDHLYFPQGNQR